MMYHHYKVFETQSVETSRYANVSSRKRYFSSTFKHLPSRCECNPVFARITLVKIKLENFSYENSMNCYKLSSTKWYELHFKI